jgi:nicotinate-nucleotide adenylyltransferase
MSIGQAAKKRVAVFGGAFDPFHKGHSAAIRHLLEEDRVDRVIVVPSGDRPDKPDVSYAVHRLAMTRIGVEESFSQNARIEVSDVQVQGTVGHATIDLVTYFGQDSSIDLLVVIGQELLPDLPSWVRAEELRERARFLVLQRPGNRASDLLLPADWKCELSKPFTGGGVHISSTEIRQRLGCGERCGDVLSQGVYDYCVRQQLYGAGKIR